MRIIRLPREIAIAGFLKSVGRDSVETETSLARQQEACETCSVELFELRGDELAPASLRVDDPLDFDVQLMRGLRGGPVMSPASGEQSADRLTERVALLGFRLCARRGRGSRASATGRAPTRTTARSCRERRPASIRQQGGHGARW